jgi:hypothetical protein
MGGLIVYNYYGGEINFDIGGKLYKIVSNGKEFIHLPPGKYNYSANIVNFGKTTGTVEIQVDVYMTLTFAPR